MPARNIELICPGTFSVMAASHQTRGPGSVAVELPAFDGVASPPSVYCARSPDPLENAVASIRPTAEPEAYVVGQSQALLTPNRACDARTDVARALPGTLVLVHGVNDLGVSYPAQEAGLCQGLNERLSRHDLHPADYRLPSPKRDEALEDDPDAVYYRRGGGGYGPVVPFYWGYREHKDFVDKNAPHGQYLDRHGNRLDKNSAKGGGPFANATSNLPDMWDGGFKAYGGVLNALNDTPTHPLLGGPDRRYFVWAAVRLAALVEAIRSHHPDETVTLIGHSQGCLLSLLAQALLAQRPGQRPADCLILNHPPYSLHEQLLERSQAGYLQQTTRARLETLIALVRLTTGQPHVQPPLSRLAEGDRCHGLTGLLWTPDAGQRPDPRDSSKWLTFAERDNRGKVYLYFCPDDLTVGLHNVNGIGTFGVPEKFDSYGPTGLPQRFTALPELGQRFFQRVFTLRERDNASYAVGQPPGKTYPLRLSGEAFHEHASTPGDARFRHLPEVGEIRLITGEALTPPCVPYLRSGETDPGRLAVDPVDAAIAITNGGIGEVRQYIDDPEPQFTPVSRQRVQQHSTKEIEARLNEGKDTGDRCTVKSVKLAGEHQLEVIRTETPNEARRRWQSQQTMSNSYHSAIVANPEHSRHVHAFDVAIGQGLALSNPTFRDLVLKLADWRVPIKKLQFKSDGVTLSTIQANPFYLRLPLHVRAVTEANARYYTEGTLPLELIPADPPAPIVSETSALRQFNLRRGAQR